MGMKMIEDVSERRIILYDVMHGWFVGGVMMRINARCGFMVEADVKMMKMMKMKKMGDGDSD